MNETKNGRPGALFIGTVLVGKYAGFEFSFLGLRSLGPFFHASGISSVAHKRTKTHKGCRFRHGLPSERVSDFPVLTPEIQKDIVDTLLKFKVARKREIKLDKDLTHIIGTVCQGKFTGTQFSFVQLKNVPSFFNVYNVSRVINGVMATYYGCNFRKATYEEAVAYYHRFTQEIADDLRMIFKPSTQVYAIPIKGKYQGVRFLLRGSKEMQRFFSPPAIYKVITGQNKSHLGCAFVQARPDDDPSVPTRQLDTRTFYEIQDELPVFFICTIKERAFNNVEVGFTSRRIANRFFKLTSVKNVLIGKRKRYKKCLFRAASYEEAAALADKLTPEIADYLS